MSEEKTYLGDVALFDDKVSHVEWAIAAEHEFLKTSTGLRVNEAMLSHKVFKGIQDLRPSGSRIDVGLVGLVVTISRFHVCECATDR